MNKPVFHVPVIVLAPVSTAVPGIRFMMSMCCFYTAWKRLVTGSDWYWLPVALSASSKCPATCRVPHLHQRIDGGKEERSNVSYCWSGWGQEAQMFFSSSLTTTSSMGSCLDSCTGLTCIPEIPYKYATNKKNTIIEKFDPLVTLALSGSKL